jgi:hypothetical protein
MDSLAFYPFYPTIRCNNIKFVNFGTQTIYIRTDPNDGNTEDVIPPGAEELLNWPTRAVRDTAWRFDPQFPVLWAEADSGNGLLIITQLE